MMTNPIFKLADERPIADKLLIVVFKDKDIICAKYSDKRDKWETERGYLNVRQIHQWAYADDFYKQLNLPEFPERPERPNASELIKGLEGLFDALSKASVEVHVLKADSKGKGLKDLIEEAFGENTEIFKSNSKH